MGLNWQEQPLSSLLLYIENQFRMTRLVLSLTCSATQKQDRTDDDLKQIFALESQNTCTTEGSCISHKSASWVADSTFHVHQHLV
jgi:hypothetical protein